MDLHTTYSATGLGVDASLTRAVVIAVPGLTVARHNNGMWPADVRGSSLPPTSVSLTPPAAQWSVNQVLLTASKANRVCLAGLGCNKAKSLTDPGFSRVSLQTDSQFVGRYFICIDAHTTCFVISALPLLATSDCPTSAVTQLAVFRVVLLPGWTPCASVGTISLLVDPIRSISPTFVTVEGGEHVASIAVGASTPAAMLRLTGAAGDVVSGFRVRAHVLEGAADVTTSGPPLVDPASWRTSLGVLLRGEWSLLSNASGIAVMPEAFGIDWLLPSSSSPSSIFRLVFCIDGDETAITCSEATALFRLVWGDPLVRRQAQQGGTLRNIQFTLQPPAFVVPGENFHPDSDAGIEAASQSSDTRKVTGTIHILPTFSSHSAGLQFWRPPSLELVAVRELPAATQRGGKQAADAGGLGNQVDDGLVTACSVQGIYRWQWLQEQTQTKSRLVFSDSIDAINSSNASNFSIVASTTNATLETGSSSTSSFPSLTVGPEDTVTPSYSQEWKTREVGVPARVRWEVSSLRLGACVNGVYRLEVRAVPDADISPQRLFLPSLPTHRKLCQDQTWAIHPRTLAPAPAAAHVLQGTSLDCPTPWAPQAQLTGHAGGTPPAGAAQAAVKSRAFNVGAHGPFRLAVRAQPPSTVETLLIFSTSVQIIGNSEALLEGVFVSCSLEEESVMWPGVSEAAFDAGGYPPLFAPRRNESNVTDSKGIATFYLKLTRADPSRRIRLLYTAFSRADVATGRDLAAAEKRTQAAAGSWMRAIGMHERIALATEHSRYFHVKHHFARLTLQRRLTYDEEVAKFLTTPLGAMEFAGGGSPATMKGNLGKPGTPDPDDSDLNSSNFKFEVKQSNPMRILALTTSFDASIDATSIVSPVVAVFDHTEQFVGGLAQACKAAGCFNHVTLDKFKNDVLQLRLRYYLLNSNGSLIDGVSVQRVEKPVWGGVAEKKGYWWLASTFQPWLPSGFYLPVFELDGLWMVQKQQIWIQNNRKPNVGNVFPIERPTFHYYICLLTCLIVPYLSAALSPEATKRIKRTGMVLAILAFINLNLYLGLYPPCEPDITSPYGCTNLNWDPGTTGVIFETSVWMTIFSNGSVMILAYVTLGLFFYNFLVALPPPSSTATIATAASSTPDPAQTSAASAAHAQTVAEKRPAPKPVRKGGLLSESLPDSIVEDFRTLRHKQLRTLFIRILLPPKATRALDEWQDRKNLKGWPEPEATELWWEGSSPSAAHIRKQRLVNWLYKMLRHLVRARNKMNYIYWTRMYPKLPLNSVQFEQLTDFKFPQRMYLATMAALVLLMVLQLFLAAQFNRVGTILELSRHQLLSEVAHINRYALDFAQIRNKVAKGVLPFQTQVWNIGRPSPAGQVHMLQVL
jgi:hypothetical protein